jgi:putative protease
MASGRKDASVRAADIVISYKYNVANAPARALYEARGAQRVEPAYELAHPAGAELMRTRYCIRYELGLCPVHQGAKESRPLFLLNNGRRLALHFDCAKCEMTVTEDA